VNGLAVALFEVFERQWCRCLERLDLNQLDTPFLARLANATVSPKDVTHVLLTHIHTDDGFTYHPTPGHSVDHMSILLRSAARGRCSRAMCCTIRSSCAGLNGIRYSAPRRNRH
jgi:hypothetical protein